VGAGLLKAIALIAINYSAALPLIFPAVRLADGWYGDGGIRFHAPFSPAIHLGARRILAVSIRYRHTREEADQPAIRGYPAGRPGKLARPL